MEKSVCILKFGGTSVGNGERIRRVAAIVADTVEQSKTVFPVVVVSAMAGVTDQLLRIARYACSHQRSEYKEELVHLRQKHIAAVAEITDDEEERSRLLAVLERALAGLARDVEALREAAEVGQEVHLHTAAVAAWGERLSVLLVAAATRAIGCNAQALDQEIIITRHPTFDPAQPFGVVVGADPLMEETRANAQALIRPLVEQKVVPITVGFIGRTLTGFVPSLGRNGSD